ncbi:YiaAB two helix domain-containing protein [Sphingomonas antarctica]|uniref:hypothetical protein n=1 Tax=Sphingomonas antarctica TaxID=2040274 RepID=UPI0039E998C1
MFSKIGRLFVIKTRTEAFLIIYALAVGAIERGEHYMATYHGFGGWMLAAACTGSVFLAGAAILDGIKAKAALAQAMAPDARRRSIRASS